MPLAENLSLMPCCAKNILQVKERAYQATDLRSDLLVVLTSDLITDLATLAVWKVRHVD